MALVPNGIPNGVYLVLNFDTGTVLQPDEGIPTEGIYLTGAARTSATYQQWEFVYSFAEGGYTIQNLASGLYASPVQLAGTYEGYEVWQTNAAPGYFNIDGGTAPGAYYIYNTNTSYLMDLYERNATDGTPVIWGNQNVPDLSTNQQWSLAYVD